MAEMRHLRRNRTNDPPQKNSLFQLINVPLVRKPPYSPYSRVYLVPCLKKNETVYQRQSILKSALIKKKIKIPLPCWSKIWRASEFRDYLNCCTKCQKANGSLNNSARKKCSRSMLYFLLISLLNFPSAERCRTQEYNLRHADKTLISRLTLVHSVISIPCTHLCLVTGFETKFKLTSLWQFEGYFQIVLKYIYGKRDR